MGHIRSTFSKFIIFASMSLQKVEKIACTKTKELLRTNSQRFDCFFPAPPEITALNIQLQQLVTISRIKI